MNIIKSFFGSAFLVFVLFAGNTAVATDQSGTAEVVGNTIAHLEAALTALDANEADKAQEHIKAASQSAKNIIGGSLEVKAQRGSRAISTARRQIRDGNTEDAAVSLKEAVEIFKSLHQSGKSGGRGGLN